MSSVEINMGERDSLFKKVATLTIESISIEEDVNKILKAIEKSVKA